MSTPPLAPQRRHRAQPPAARIPLADAASFAPALRRLRLVRAGLAAALLLAAAGAYLAARELATTGASVVPPGADGVIVLDVSASIEAATYEQREAFQQTARVLSDAAATGGRYGVVLFSDVAYEALPATTPSTELRALLRYFLPLGADRRTRPYRTVRLGGSEFAANPWSAAFTGGTRISGGLALARTLIERDGLDDATVVLVSDLDTDDSDVAALTNVVLGYGRARIPLQVVGVGASESDRAFFRRLVGRARVAEPEPLTGAGGTDDVASARFPGRLVAFAAALLVLLAANELLCGRVALRRRIAS